MCKSQVGPEHPRCFCAHTGSLQNVDVGLVASPVIGAKEGGAVGAAKGLATGVLGAVVLPTVAVGVAGVQSTYTV